MKPTGEISKGMSELLRDYAWLVAWLNLRSSEIHLFYNLGDFYWHFLEILWLFIFLFLYSLSPPSGGAKTLGERIGKGIANHKIWLGGWVIIGFLSSCDIFFLKTN